MPSEYNRKEIHIQGQSFEFLEHAGTDSTSVFKVKDSLSIRIYLRNPPTAVGSVAC